MHVQTISLEETLPIRSIALRNGQGYDKCTIPEDKLSEAFHIGAIENEKAVGTASFFPKDLPEYEGKGFQLRMMGVLPEFQGQGIGREILISAIETVKNDYGATYLWCHAREAAYLFYEKLGFEYISGEYEIPPIGTHRKMLLHLS